MLLPVYKHESQLCSGNAWKLDRSLTTLSSNSLGVFIHQKSNFVIIALYISILTPLTKLPKAKYTYNIYLNTLNLEPQSSTSSLIMTPILLLIVLSILARMMG